MKKYYLKIHVVFLELLLLVTTQSCHRDSFHL